MMSEKTNGWMSLTQGALLCNKTTAKLSNIQQRAFSMPTFWMGSPRSIGVALGVSGPAPSLDTGSSFTSPEGNESDT